jgi:hypothetical protein
VDNRKCLFALTKERERKMLVIVLTPEQVEEHGEFGLELLVSDWCAVRKLTYMSYLLQGPGETS